MRSVTTVDHIHARVRVPRATSFATQNVDHLDMPHLDVTISLCPHRHSQMEPEDPHPPGSFLRRRPVTPVTTIPPRPTTADKLHDPEDQWEDDDVEEALASPIMSDISRTTSEASRVPERTPRSKVASPRRAGRTPRAGGTPTRLRPTPQTLRARKATSRTEGATPSRAPQNRPKPPSFTRTLLSLAFDSLLTLIRLFHAIFSPFYPYIALGVATLLVSSYVVHMFLDKIPSLLFRLLGYPIRSAFPSLAWRTPLSDDVTAVGQGLALLPLRSLATPLCALTGQACALSLVARRDGPTQIQPAAPFWRWTWRTEPDAVNVGEVARSLAKEATGAKDIFESVAKLSDGGIMDRLEYVRIWELGVAVQVGSNLDDKEYVGKGLVDLGNNAKDLSDDLVELNAMAVNAFTWLQWEFASVYKVLSQPGGTQPTTATLSNRLNNLLNRLSDTLTDLHHLTTRAHTTATRGSDQGNRLRAHLGQINADLVRQHDVEPGWKAAVEKAQHFLVGGEPSKMALIKRDVKLTRQTIDSLSMIIQDLEISRTMIKSFRDQIGQFDASMMGFHLGASEQNGIGPEEELRVLADVVGEFGRSIGRAKSGWVGSGERENETRMLEAT